MTENDKKKEYLYQYKDHVRRISRIEMELKEIRLMKICPSVVNDGMPHGSGGSDLSGYASVLDNLEHELRSERYHRIRTYVDISERIKALKNSKENDVLFYRYISGMDWWEIAEKMGCSERWIYKLHGRALAHLNSLE